MRHPLRLIAISLLASTGMLSASVFAAPVTLNFQSVPAQIGTTPTTFSENGFTFDYAIGVGGIYAIGAPQACSPVCTSNGTNAFYSFNLGSLTLTNTGGAAFSLLGLDAATTFTTLNRALELHITGQLLGGGSVSTVISTAFGAADVFSSYNLNSFTNLTSVTFTSGTNFDNREFALDNLRVDVASVPEPATLGLLSIGMLGLLAARKRRASIR